MFVFFSPFRKELFFNMHRILFFFWNPHNWHIIATKYIDIYLVVKCTWFTRKRGACCMLLCFFITVCIHCMTSTRRFFFISHHDLQSQNIYVRMCLWYQSTKCNIKCISKKTLFSFLCWCKFLQTLIKSFHFYIHFYHNAMQKKKKERDKRIGCNTDLKDKQKMI